MFLASPYLLVLACLSCRVVVTNGQEVRLVLLTIGNEFRLTTLHNNSGDYIIAPGVQRPGSEITYDTYNKNELYKWICHVCDFRLN